MTLLSAALMGLLFILAVAPASSAEYIIYLKGGHYIVTDTCTFLARQEVAKEPDAENESVYVEDCTKGKPEGPIFWSTIDGKFGEVDADNVYAIYGTKGLGKKVAPRWTLPLKEYPLEDYVITNRGESFVNAKIYQERDATVYGVKRDELAKVDRRAITNIAPEGKPLAPRAEGLCVGEPAEFSVTELEVLDGHIGGLVTNLSKSPWKPVFWIEVLVKNRFEGKLLVTDLDELPPNGFTRIYQSVLDRDRRLLEYLGRATDPQANVKPCSKKVKEVARRPASGQPTPQEPPK